MRIGQFIDTDSRGGAETVVIELSRALAQAGHEPVVLHFGSPHLDRYCRRLGLEQRILPAHGHYKSTRTLPLFARSFARVLRQEGIGALHAHLFGPVTASAIAGRLAGIPTVGTLHDVYSITEKPQRIRLLQLSALLGCRLVTVSRDMRRIYRGIGWFPAAQLQTIYNGVRVPAVEPEEIAAARAELALPPTARVLLSVGRLVELKRHEILIRALAEIPKFHPIYLLCAGDGPRLEALRQVAADRGVADRVKFLGNRDDVPTLLRLADAFALASSTEGLSCSILEAMAAGVPAVVTDVGGNPELVEHGRTGYLVPAGDVQAMSRRLAQLLTCDEALQRMGRASSERARELFSFDAMMSAYLGRYGLAGLRERGNQSGLRTRQSL